MILRAFWYRFIALVGGGVAVLLLPQTLNADSSKYPQFAQQTLPENVTPTFIGVEQLVADIKAGVKPVIIDVRTAEEYREAHILGAVSAPLDEFKDYLKSIPRDRPVVLY
jgi:3-mercaptopyruvate sulfurtransferase SseA